MIPRLVLFVVGWVSSADAHADDSWTSNGVHKGLLTLNAPAPGAALDSTNVPGGHSFIGRCTLSYALWLLEGEPAHDFVFSWDWRTNDIRIAERVGRAISTKDLAKYPDLSKTFAGLKPLSVTLDTVIEFYGSKGERLATGRKRVSLGSLEQAGATNMLHLPGSPRWADFFDVSYPDNPSRDELDRRHKELFQKSARVQLSALKLSAVSWPEATIKGLVNQFEQREGGKAQRPSAPPPVQPEPNPLELAFRAAYSGRFRGQDLDLLLRPEAGHWSGTLIFQGKNYQVAATQNSTGFAGKFSNASKSWSFSAVAQGTQLSFTAGTFTTLLQRQFLADITGHWRSSRVLIAFDPRPRGAPARREDSPPHAVGQLEFDGQQYSFTAQEKEGELSGTAQGQEKTFPFQIAWAENGLAFKTGSLVELLAPVPNRSGLRVRGEPPLPFALFNAGKPVAAQDGRYGFVGDQTLQLQARADGFYAARTNFWLPGYSEVTWEIHWQKRVYPGLMMPAWTNSLQMVFVPVPGTKVLFCACDTRVNDYASYAEAATGADPSWRKAEFQGAPVSNNPQDPVTMVSWRDAQAFCRWLTDSEQEAGLLAPGQSYRLPTDAEWSLAAGLPAEKGASPKDKDMKIKGVFPWGNQWPPPAGSGNFADRAAAAHFQDMNVIDPYEDGFATTSPVGRFAANRYGLYDLAGNVWQWCDDWYDARREKHIVRGGSWRSCEPRVLWSSHRGTAPDVRDASIGFRCVLAVDAQEQAGH